MESIGWHMRFACAIEHQVPVSISPAVGVDCGIVKPRLLSIRKWVSIRSKCRAQRILVRRKRGSKRRVKQVQRVACCSARIALMRQDCQDRVSIDIARRFGTGVLENLKIGN